MLCPECNKPLMISGSRFESEEGSTEVYRVLTLVCINSTIDPVKKKPVCSLYCGPDLNNPLKIAAENREKVN